MARTKLRGPLQALYFLSLPSLNPEAHPYPKEASEASWGLADSPGGTLAQLGYRADTWNKQPGPHPAYTVLPLFLALCG